LGTPQDKRKAAAWFERAARQGFEASEEALQELAEEEDATPEAAAALRRLGLE